MYKCWMQGHDYNATGVYNDGTMIVKAGSTVSSKDSSGKKIAKIAATLRKDKSLIDKNNKLIKDLEFKSVTTAAQFVSGNIVNGNRYWKEERSNKTIGEIIKGEQNGV